MTERVINYTFKDREAAAREFGHLATWYSQIIRKGLSTVRLNEQLLWKDPGFLVEAYDDLTHVHSQMRELTEAHLANWLYATWPERFDAEITADIKAVLTLISHTAAEIGFACHVAGEYVEKQMRDAPREARMPYAQKVAWAVYRATHVDRDKGYADDGVVYLDVIADKISKGAVETL